MADSSAGGSGRGLRWDRIQRLFERAVELDTAGRRQFLDQLSGADAELRDEVTSLLEADAKAETFIEQAVHSGAQLLGEGRAPPDRLGKYEVREVVGRGGFGVVFRGHDRALRRDVAIKVCSSGDERLRQRFFREAHIVAGLQHPNITTVHELGSEGGIPFLVQEFLGGEDLNRLLQRAERPGLERKLDILLQVARGLEYAHDRGVLHRDVKPANVRLLEDGTVKIMDFGIAKALQEETRLTVEGQALGTVGYLPPEQLKGERVDPRSDVFSFGVLAYELLAGRRPFDGDTFSQVSYRLLYEEAVPLREVAPDCPPGLAAIVHRCLQKDPAARYADFGEVLADLERGAPAGGVVSETGRRIWPAAAILGVLLLGTAGGWWLRRAEPPAPTSEALETGAASGIDGAQPPAVAAPSPQDPRPAAREAEPPPLAGDSESRDRASAAETGEPLPAPARESPLPAAGLAVPPPSAGEEAVDSVAASEPDSAPPPDSVDQPSALRSDESGATGDGPATAQAGARVEDRPASETAGPPPPPTMQPGDLIPSGEGVRPRLLEQPAFTYPTRALRREVEARVVVAVLVDETGRVVRTLLKRRADFDLGFDEAALEAAGRARFRPATKDGVAGKMWTEMTFDFRLPE